MYIADFADNGQFSGVVEKLDYLKDLGFNAIELMPIQGEILLSFERNKIISLFKYRINGHGS